MAVSSIGEKTDLEYIGSWFAVELDNGISGLFKSIAGIGIEVAVVDATDSSGKTESRKRPGTAKVAEITLKRTLTPDKGFWDWCKRIRDGDGNYRCDGAVTLHDIGGTEIGRWTFMNCWPSKWSASDLDVGSDDLMEEEVTLMVEQIIRNT